MYTRCFSMARRTRVVRSPRKSGVFKNIVIGLNNFFVLYIYMNIGRGWRIYTASAKDSSSASSCMTREKRGRGRIVPTCFYIDARVGSIRIYIYCM